VLAGGLNRFEAMDFPFSKMDHAHLLDDVFRMVARKCPEAWICFGPKWKVSKRTVF